MAKSKALYANGSIIKFKNGEQSLQRLQVRYMATQQDKTHIVKEDEDLLRISFKYYSSTTLWYVIAEANNLVDFWDELVPGMRLVIPNNDILVKIW